MINLPLGKLALGIGASRFKSWLYGFQLPASVVPGRKEVMARVVGILFPVWKTQIEVWATVSKLAMSVVADI